MNIAIIFAGGLGTRLGAELPKQFIDVEGKPLIIHTLELFEEHPLIDRIYIGITEGFEEKMKGLAEKYGISKTVDVITGGDSAMDTIYRLLKRAEQDCDGDSIVLLHDGVRPYITPELITKHIDTVKEKGNAITSTGSIETVVVSKNGETIEYVPYRKETYSVQAPQSFYLKDIIDAHEEIRKRPEGYENMIDACTIMKTLGREVYMVEGNRGNIKVTTPVDVYMLEALLKYRKYGNT